MANTRCSIHKVESISELERAVRNRIQERAYQLAEADGMKEGQEHENWLAAEREITWQSLLELTERSNEFVLQLAVPGVDPQDLDIRVSPDDLLITAAKYHRHNQENGTVHVCEFSSGTLFRIVHFPRQINVDRVQTEVRNGVLQLTAEVAREPRRKVARAGA